MDLFANRSDAVIRGAVEYRRNLIGARGGGSKTARGRGGFQNANDNYVRRPPDNYVQPQQSYSQAQMDNIIQAVQANNQYRPSSITNKAKHYADAAETVYKSNEPPGTGVFGMAGNRADAEADQGIFTNMGVMERAGMTEQTIADTLNQYETEMTCNPNLWTAIGDNVGRQLDVLDTARRAGKPAGEAMDGVTDTAVERQLAQFGPQVVQYYNDRRRQNRSTGDSSNANRMPASESNGHRNPTPADRPPGGGDAPRRGDDQNDPPAGLQRVDPNNPWFKNVNAEGVQRLGYILDEINMERLWNGGSFRTTLGAFVTHLVRLITTAYSREEESAAVKMIHEAMVRGSLVTNDPRRDSTNFWDVYRMRAGFLVGWANFRRLLEQMELKEILTRKHKTDLNMLYILLSSADVRLYRETIGADTVSFFDPITGYELRTPPLLNQPLLIDLHLQDMFGNIARSTKLLDRSINTANSNAKRKREPASEDEIIALLDMSVPLVIDEPPGFDDIMPMQLDPETEQTVLREMLANTMVVSMMAEEFRVFVGDMQTNTGPKGRRTNKAATTGTGKPPSADDVIDADNGFAFHTLEALPKNARHRRPIFYTFVKSNTISTRQLNSSTEK